MIDRKKFGMLKDTMDDHCVSIYIPTEKTGDYEKNRIRWKNAISEAKDLLDERGVNTDILDEASELTNDSNFWAHQSHGLAMFASEGINEIIHLQEQPPTIVEVGKSFFLSPIVKECTNNSHAYILALSVNDVKLYSVTKNEIEEVHIADKVVLSQEEALRNVNQNQSLQHHSTGFGNANFHGNGPGSDMDSIRIKQFMRRVDDGLREVISDTDSRIILAAVEEHHSRYKEVSGFTNIADFVIVGNPEEKSLDDLYDEMKQYYEVEEKERLANFKETYNQKLSEQLVVEDIGDTLKMAEYNNIEKLLINNSSYAEMDKDLRLKLDEAILEVYDSGGEVIYTDEDDEPVRSVLRYRMDFA